MWFDVQAALAEIDHEPAERPTRVARVAHVARFPASEAETFRIEEKAVQW